MTSAIDATKPTAGIALTADVRANFQTAADEISALQSAIATLQSDIATLKARTMAAGTTVTANPPNTSSPAFITAGIPVEFAGGRIASSSSTRAVVIIDGVLGNTANASVTEVQIVYGPGAAPAGGALVSGTNGTLVGGVASMQSARAGDYGPFSCVALLTGLTAGAAFWVDVAYRAVSGTATLSEASIVAFEMLDPVP